MDRNDSWRPLTPNYTIRRYTDQIYKVCYFPNGAPNVCVDRSSTHQSYDKKLDASISRSKRIVLELGLCNDWKYFCTFTINSVHFDRTNLSVFRSVFSQFIRDYRKKAKSLGLGHSFDFLLVPELHSDGKSWHMHGLFSVGIEPFLKSFKDCKKDDPKIPQYLVDAGYLNWVDFQKKFGFCSFGVIENKVACGFYITKYMSKSLCSSSLPVGSHMIFHSIGLNKSSPHTEIYGHSSYLDQFLVNDYEFCKTGMTHLKDGLDFTFGLAESDFEPLDISNYNSVDQYYDYTQMAIEGACYG